VYLYRRGLNLVTAIAIVVTGLDPVIDNGVIVVLVEYQDDIMSQRRVVFSQ
jgi:hypothetical protein